MKKDAVLWVALLGAGILPGADKSAPKPPEPPQQQVTGSRLIEYGDRDVAPVATRLRFTTMIVLPKQEQILDFVCGDKEFWVVNGSQNFAFVKPAKAGGQTNLNLITASGNVYSFVLTEVGDKGSPDLKVFVEAKGDGMVTALNAQPRFVPAQAVDDYRQQIEVAKAQARHAEENAKARIVEAQRRAERERDQALAQYPAALQFSYRFRKEPVFGVSAIYHDNRFTYIKASPQETPAVYEVKDGKPSLVQFRYQDGLYTMDKIVRQGYLAIGKKRLLFEEE